jgi:hypothetical protein
MHVMEVALFTSLMRPQREHHEPMPDQWPRPRRSRTATAARAAVTIGIAMIVVAVVVAS